MMPAQGVIQYYVEKQVGISLHKDVAVIMMTDGFEARRYEHVMQRGTLPNSIPDSKLQIAWDMATIVPMRMYREAGHRDSATVVEAAVDAALNIIMANAAPELSDVLVAIGGVLANHPRKFNEFQKVAIMLRDADQADVRKFMAFIAMVAMVGVVKEG